MNPKSALNIKQQVFNITAALYKVTERLSVDEPLRNRLRERGVELMMIVQDVFSGKTVNSDIQAILKQEIDNICFLLSLEDFALRLILLIFQFWFNPTNLYGELLIIL